MNPEFRALGLNLWSTYVIGIDVTAHDIRFVEDNWESPVIFILVYNYFSAAYWNAILNSLSNFILLKLSSPFRHVH